MFRVLDAGHKGMNEAEATTLSRLVPVSVEGEMSGQ
jgi:hypothetical protein